MALQGPYRYVPRNYVGVMELRAVSLSVIVVLLVSASIGAVQAAEPTVEVGPLSVAVLPELSRAPGMKITTLAALPDGSAGGLADDNVIVYAVLEGKFDQATIEAFAKRGKFETGDRDGMTTFTATSSDGTATAGEDFAPLSASVRLLPGGPMKTIPIPFLDDEIVEPPEVFFLMLSARGKKGTKTKMVTVILLDDDAEDGSNG